MRSTRWWPAQKFDLLRLLLEQTQYHSVIIFSRTKMGADRIAQPAQAGHTVGVMHSDRSQRERIEALEGFKSGKYEVLVATDIAARGLDIADVSHVINYDVPENPEDYVHRIGRTGRAHKTGDAFTLVTEETCATRAASSASSGQRGAEEDRGLPLHLLGAVRREGAGGVAAATAKPTSRLHKRNCPPCPWRWRR
jgi:ATP-dependent RNA helicase RhlE